jgi:hypothetical protein
MLLTCDHSGAVDRPSDPPFLIAREDLNHLPDCDGKTKEWLVVGSDKRHWKKAQY